MSAAPEALPAVDCHVHLFDPARFPYSAAYRPGSHETATVEQLLGVLDAHAVSHALLVTPTSGYGSDNAAAADAIGRYPDRFKGIAVVEPDVTEAEIAALKASGFVGVRLDLVDRGAAFLTGAGRRLVAMLRDQAMVMQLQVRAPALTSEMVRLLREEAGEVVIDHMGLPDPETGPEAGVAGPGFAMLLALADRPHVAVKLSGPFRFSARSYPYSDADTYAAAILAAFGPERCVWGSDWPFVRMGHRVDYGPSRAALDRWLPDPAAQRRVLWETPRRLFGFKATA